MDLGYYIGLLQRRWLPIVICLLAGIGGAVTLTTSQPKVYTASSRLFVNIPGAPTVQVALQGVQLSSQLLESFTRIATSRTAAERIATRLNRKLTPAQVQGKLSAAAQKDTLLIDVSATDTDPARAAEVANAAAETLTELITEFDPRAEGAVAARIIDRARTPTRPISPRPKNNLTLGVLLGLAAGAVVAFSLEALDRSVKTAAQAEQAYAAPVLAALPRQRRMRDEPLSALDQPNSAAGEAYRSLRTSLRFLDAEAPLATILVTSAITGEGKTTVAANLAIAIAQGGERVIAIDADLRRSRLASLFGVADGPGLTSVVYGELSLEEALHTTRPNLAVLPPGPLPKNQSEVLGSEAMATLLKRAGELADVVIIDAPPVLPVTDAAVLSALVDGVVMISRFGTTERGEAAEASRTLRGVKAALVGVVINGVRGPRDNAYYRNYKPADRTPR
jgi:capsular exopolysaccharide synthesis family protein